MTDVETTEGNPWLGKVSTRYLWQRAQWRVVSGLSGWVAGAGRLLQSEVCPRLHLNFAFWSGVCKDGNVVFF